MKTLEQILDEIEEVGLYTKEQIFSSGATHIAQDKCGDVFAYKAAPKVMSGAAEWMRGYKKGSKIVLFCGALPKPENWKECIWELPQSGDTQFS